MLKKCLPVSCDCMRGFVSQVECRRVQRVLPVLVNQGPVLVCGTCANPWL